MKIELESDEVRKMSPAKLGEIMCALEHGDVMVGRTELLSHAHFAGDCEELLRSLVSTCLAYAILERLNDFSQTGVPQYKPRLAKMRTREVLDELDDRFKR